jgi:hypothetical protein
VPLGFVFGALALWLSDPSGLTLLSGGLIAVVGEALRVWAAGHLNKAREVTSSGPYRWLAHPLYVGSSIMGVGLAVASGTFVVALLVAAYLGVTMAAAIKSEEAFLRRTFGDDYDRYRRGDATRGDSRSKAFSLRRAIANREHRAIGGLVAAALLLALKATYNGLFWPAAGARFIRPGG